LGASQALLPYGVSDRRLQVGPEDLIEGKSSIQELSWVVVLESLLGEMIVKFQLKKAQSGHVQLHICLSIET
jgi:hypothetical protein